MILVVGSLNLDLVGRAPRIPAPGETVLGGELARFHGGKGGNQAVAAARLGAQVMFVGAVGSDPFGDELVAGLIGEGVNATGVARVGGASGAALITVDDGGDNAITVLPGANRWVARPSTPLPAPLRVLLMQFELPIDTTLAWAQAARSAGVPVVLNAAPFVPMPQPLLGAVDTLIVNQHELAELAGTADLDEGLRRAERLGPRRVIVTLGARGCVAAADGQRRTVPGLRVDVVDTTGAGDTFCGAYAASIAAGAPMDEALTRANAAAALSCTRAGARGGMPSAAELAQAMAQ
jgi:ribokinase